MRRRKYLIYCFICMLLFTGCRQKEETVLEKNHIYYMNLEETGLTPEKYKITGETTEEQLESMLEAMQEASDSTEYKSVFVKETAIEKWEIHNEALELYFAPAYYDMETSYEVLFRAAIVQSVVQIEGIDYVCFYVDDEPLLDMEGQEIGYLIGEDFVQNIGPSLHTYEEGEVTLYFANEKGSKLKEETIIVTYNSNTLYEKMIVEKLLEGPKEKMLYPTIAPDTRLLGVSIKDDICYVNLDESFLTTVYSLDPNVTVYSIVNSIIDAGNCSKVQILLNGEANVMYRDSIDLSEPFTKNTEIVEG